MASLTFEVDFQAEASVVTAAAKLAAIRRYVGVCAIGGDLADPAIVLRLTEGEPEAMRVWTRPSTDGTTEHIEITES